MTDGDAIATELQGELEALLTDDLVREIVAAGRSSWLASLLSGTVL
jgi:hypothetical protein